MKTRIKIPKPTMPHNCTIRFQDGGQDFIYWDIEKGYVVGCRPFQGSVWCGRSVMNSKHLIEGGFVEITSGANHPRFKKKKPVADEPTFFIKYAIAEVLPLAKAEKKKNTKPARTE